MTRRKYPAADPGWQFDRRIPVATIAVMLIQTFSVVWWAATVAARVDALEARTVAHEELFKERGKSLGDLTQRAATTEALVSALQKQYESIERKLDTALERRK